MHRRTKILLVVMIFTMIIALYWDSLTFVKESVGFVLDPSAGQLLNWNINVGMFVIVLIISLSISLLQKFTVDQETLKTFKKEQKLLQEEIKKYKEHPEKMIELQKKQLEFIPRTFDITMRPVLYTAIPIVLFFRWFSDYFTMLEPTKVLWLFSTDGFWLIFPSWLWAYLILTITFSQIFRKMFGLV